MGAPLCVMGADLGPAAGFGPPLAASALEGLGILAYAGLVYLVLRVASRWADRSHDETADASPIGTTSSASRDSKSTKGPGA